MKCAVFGDVHGNFDALQVVLDDIERERPDAICCVGDLVGYGAEPARCIKAVAALRCPIVAGNHDYAVAGKTDTSFFNAEALEAVMWSRLHLPTKDIAFLANLKLTGTVEASLLVHGTPLEPARFDYLLSMSDAERAFEATEQRVCFVGHSHIPVTFWRSEEIRYDNAPKLDLSGAHKIIINVGSVGQPRDRDPRAAYALFDTETRRLEIRRLQYDWESAGTKIIAAGLPAANAFRLAIGV